MGIYFEFQTSGFKTTSLLAAGNGKETGGRRRTGCGKTWLDWGRHGSGFHSRPASAPAGRSLAQPIVGASKSFKFGVLFADLTPADHAPAGWRSERRRVGPFSNSGDQSLSEKVSGTLI